MNLKYLIFTLIAFLVVGGPIAYSTVFGGGAQRFSYISVVSDPTTEPEVGTARGVDAKARGEIGTGLSPTVLDRLIHNKFTFWGSKVLNNYFEPFSADFLFNRGDPNLRHSIEGMGMFYKIEAIALVAGLVLFFSSKSIGLKTKFFVGFWIFAGVIPASITRDGGHHATRLIIILPPLVFLISYGLVEGFNLLKNKNYRLILIASYLLLFAISFFSYQHNYWVHNPTYSERWWHSGFRESIKEIKRIDQNYDRVAISTANEPPWVFFAAWYEYDPAKWQREFPIGNDIELAGFGRVSHIDKYYFGSPEGGLYEWGQVLDTNTLYLATEKEVKVNLIMEPERLPADLTLVKSVAYPSGEPAFYIFSGKK